MEIPYVDNMINESIDINNEIISKFKSYIMYSYDVKIRDEKKFIGSIIVNENVILRIEYVICGSFSKDKNIWIWSDKSQSINNKSRILIRELRSSLIQTLANNNELKDEIKSELKNFCSSDYSIIPTLDLVKYLFYMSSMISKVIKNSNMLTITRDSYIDFLIIKKILYNGIEQLE